MYQKIKKYLFATCFIFLVMETSAQQNQLVLLVGSYTKSCPDGGIYTYRFNQDTGNFQQLHSIGISNPSFLTLSPDRQFIYCVNEDQDNSRISALSFDKANEKLHLLNSQDSQGNDPCYVVNDAKHVIAANYSGGTIAVFGKNPDGSLSPAKQVIRHQGSSINKERQEKPHVHMVQFSPDRQFVLANDLGTDGVYLYSYHPDAGDEILRFCSKTDTKPGSGPRHLVFSPDGKFVFLLHELDGTLTAFSYREGQLQKVGETSVVPEDFKGKISAADIHISNDGKFLYASNREDANTISVFAVHEGKLQHVETIPSGGNGPRNFTLSPNGKFMLVAHEKSGNIVIFNRNSQTGKLTETGKQVDLCAPVCLVFAE
jgi:6-phosphogluconolactonase